MKNQYFIRLASLLLVSMMLLSSCDFANGDADKGPSGTETTTESVETEAPKVEDTEEEETLIDPVDPVLKNFFTFKSATAHKNLTKVERMDGEVIATSADCGMIVLRNADVDLQNRATETFTVYNTTLGKSVLEVSNSYTYRTDYTDFDWDLLCVQDPDVRYPEAVLSVRLLTVGVFDLIEVRRATVSVLTEEDGDLYAIETLYEYYDAAGQKLTQTKNASTPYVQSTAEEGSLLSVAGVGVLMDAETGLALRVSDADGGVVRLGYSDQTERYGYYFYQTQPSAHGSSRDYFEVYDKKENNRVLRFYLEECSGYSVFAMQNGDVFIQYLNEVEKGSGMSYDLSVSGVDYALASYIVDLPGGKVKAVDCSYLIFSMDDREEFSKLYEMESKGIYVTENAVNLCVAMPIVNKTTASALKVIVLNNDGSLMYEMKSIIPEHVASVSTANPMGFEISAKGDYIVELDGVLDADRAIVSADGRVRSYLRPEAIVVGEYVVYEDGIYDYDLKLLYSFKENGFVLSAVFGTKILVSSMWTPPGPDGSREYREVFKKDDHFEQSLLFTDAILEEIGDGYMIVAYPEDDHRYLYNANLSCILTTQSDLNVYRLEDHYIVATDITTKTGTVSVLYTVSE